MAINKIDLFFVYGTLMSSFDSKNAHILRKYASLLGEASVSGVLYNISWYPGLVTKPASGRVWGELYQIADGSRLWPVLDAYEGVDSSTLSGEEYRRELVEVDFAGEAGLAWTYVYIGPVQGEPIHSGRFKMNM